MNINIALNTLTFCLFKRNYFKQCQMFRVEIKLLQISDEKMFNINVEMPNHLKKESEILTNHLRRLVDNHLACSFASLASNYCVLKNRQLLFIVLTWSHTGKEIIHFSVICGIFQTTKSFSGYRLRLKSFPIQSKINAKHCLLMQNCRRSTREGRGRNDRVVLDHQGSVLV